MYEYIELGPVPADENCAQVGQEDYEEKARKECNVYRNQLLRMLADAGYSSDKFPEKFKLVIRPNNHDFGTYYEVAVRYDSDSQEALEFALMLEEIAPMEWDEEARAELASTTI